MDVEVVEQTVEQSVVEQQVVVEEEKKTIEASESSTSCDLEKNVSSPTNQNNKRPLETDDEIMCTDEQQKAAKQEEKKASPFQSEEEKKIKRLKTQSFKNAVQLLNEIQQIKPLSFEFDSPPLGTPKPVFNCRAKFTLNSNEICFEAAANSKKLAKTLASIKSIDFLTNVAQIFLSATLIDYYRTSISIELKSLNLSLEDIADSTKHVDSQQQQNQQMECSSPKMINSPVSIPSYSYYLLKNDHKTAEMIRSQNPITILNYLVPNELKSGFVYGDGLNESGGGNSTSDEATTVQPQIEIDSGKLFKVVFKIRKDLQSSRFTRNAAIIEPRESIFIKENDEEFHFIGFGPSKKKAKYKAAILALDYLFNIKITNSNDQSQTVNSGVQHHHQDHDEQHQGEEALMKKEEMLIFSDEIHQLIVSKYQEIIETITKSNSDIKRVVDLNEINLNKFLNVYSAIVQTDGLDAKTAKLVCFTTGTKCISGEHMSMTGTALNDCHAEILAVRLLRKYFYKQLKELIKHMSENPESPNLEGNIFEINKTDETSSGKLFRLKSHIKFHLFISSAPCGDGRIFSVSDHKTFHHHVDNHPQRKVRGLLRAKIEIGMGTIPVTNKDKLQTWDGIMLGERLRVMSCSDKLCKYNVLGVQGALLSHFVDTVYLDSVMIGAHFHRRHLERALYQRVSKHETELPHGFKLNKPMMSSITNHSLRTGRSPSNKSLIWSNELSDEFNVEIINTKGGKQVNERTSDVCKLELFKDWIECLDLSLNVKELREAFEAKFSFDNNNEAVQLRDAIIQMTYHDVKQRADDYQKSKLLIYKTFEEKNFGKWVTKPFEQDYFTISPVVS